MRAIVDTMDELGIAVGPNNRKFISMVDNEVPINTGEAFPSHYLEALRALWADKGVQTVYARAHEYALYVSISPSMIPYHTRLFAVSLVLGRCMREADKADK
jgi:hypothetical protein